MAPVSSTYSRIFGDGHEGGQPAANDSAPLSTVREDFGVGFMRARAQFSPSARTRNVQDIVLRDKGGEKASRPRQVRDQPALNITSTTHNRTLPVRCVVPALVGVPGLYSESPGGDSIYVAPSRASQVSPPLNARRLVRSLSPRGLELEAARSIPLHCQDKASRLEESGECNEKAGKLGAWLATVQQRCKEKGVGVSEFNSDAMRMALRDVDASPRSPRKQWTDEAARDRRPSGSPSQSPRDRGDRRIPSTSPAPSRHTMPARWQPLRTNVGPRGRADKSEAIRIASRINAPSQGSLGGDGASHGLSRRSSLPAWSCLPSERERRNEHESLLTDSMPLTIMPTESKLKASPQPSPLSSPVIGPRSLLAGPDASPRQKRHDQGWGASDAVPRKAAGRSERRHFSPKDLSGLEVKVPAREPSSSPRPEKRHFSPARADEVGCRSPPRAEGIAGCRAESPSPAEAEVSCAAAAESMTHRGMQHKILEQNGSGAPTTEKLEWHREKFEWQWRSREALKMRAKDASAKQRWR